MYSEKVAKFCVITTVDLSYVVPVKSTVEISQNYVAFSEYMKFMYNMDFELRNGLNWILCIDLMKEKLLLKLTTYVFLIGIKKMHCFQGEQEDM